MNVEEALLEMETLNKMIMINHWINECSSNHEGVKGLIEKVHKLMIQLVDKQQSVAMNTVVEEARSVDLSRMEGWGIKK